MTQSIKFICRLYCSSKNPIITAFGIVPIGVAIPPIDEEYAIHKIKIFEKKLSLFCETRINNKFNNW